MATLPDTVRTHAPPRACALPMSWNPDSMDRLAETAARLGFNRLLALAGDPADPAAEKDGEGRLPALARAAHRHGLVASVAACLGTIRSDHELSARVAPEAFSLPPPSAGAVVDPRAPVMRAAAVVRLRRPATAALLAWWRDRLGRLRDMGVDEFAHIDGGAAGVALADMLALSDEIVCEFRTVDVARPESGGNFLICDEAACVRAMPYAALLADGWAVTAGIATAHPDMVEGINSILRQRAAGDFHSLRSWTSLAEQLSIRSRAVAEGGVVLVENRGGAAAPWPPHHVPPMPWQDLRPAAGFSVPDGAVAPGGIVLLTASAAAPVAVSARLDARQATTKLPRVLISRVSPSVDRGAYAIKRVAGEWIDVEADIFADGHDLLAASVLVRAADETEWTRHAMAAAANDVWRASVRFARLGWHEFLVEAWRDIWGNFAHDLELKHGAGLDLKLELREAEALIRSAIDRAPREIAADLRSVLRELEQADQGAAAALLLGPLVAGAMQACDEQLFCTRSFVQPVVVEREAARFSSWYELFPRSQTEDAARHGTFADVIARLPHIAAMGFDTLYFPPIHPIGTVNRKGRNNALTPSAEDVGSPYAIGSALGGHDAIHPELGTLADFQALLAACAAHGLEMALDFAIQCAPDHPWLTQHPGWFAWRPDGSIKYAENPPKKYQDIVNVEFYAEDSVPSLWQALRDVVLYWAGFGVRTFRVDNPHTKPMPFWEWMIAEVKARYPDAIFLSEAFTRPKPMYHLAKAGFSQSYSYFTWRNTKAELTAYFTELAETEVREFFRPHLFVNTPDINPLFLQTSGRGGFLIRAALAATLSGLWGVYAGFELCEAAALPGREEYLDSEKYEIRPRPARAPGDIVDEITRLNQLRRSEPALQTHLGVTFHTAHNDRILYYSKAAPGQTSRILVVVSLDAAFAQSADFEVPLWLFDLPDWESVLVSDLIERRDFTWSGKMQHVDLLPERPYAIWRIAPRLQIR